MKKSKFNPELLKEELNKFKLLSEYDFYQEKKELPEFKDLILGDIDEEDKVPSDLEPSNDDTESAANNVASELGVDDMDSESGDEEFSGDIPEPDAEEPISEPEPLPEPTNDDVEVDVTSLVKGSEEAKEAADSASQNTELLLQKLTDLESRVANMDKITSKIEGLEKEIIKRNPSPVEKLEMRSLSSFPYSQKLTDYWADKEGAYDVMNNGNKKKEYVLTKDDVDSDYSDSSIKKTFTAGPEDNDGYEEEEI
jgi:hypothetical protein